MVELSSNISNANLNGWGTNSSGTEKDVRKPTHNSVLPSEFKSIQTFGVPQGSQMTIPGKVIQLEVVTP